jgi:hypothetical protein
MIIGCADDSAKDRAEARSAQFSWTYDWPDRSASCPGRAVHTGGRSRSARPYLYVLGRTKHVRIYMRHIIYPLSSFGCRPLIFLVAFDYSSYLFF